MMMKIMGWMAWVVCGYLVWLGVLTAVQRRVIFPRHLTGPVPALPAVGREVEVFPIDPGFGPVPCIFMAPAPGEKAPLVIFAHGNAELAGHCVAELAGLIPPEFGVLLVEYPGYGDSAGSVGKNSIRRTFEAAYDAAVKRPEVDPEKVAGFGRSMGTAAICQLADTRPLCALVLVSAFTRMVDLTRKYLIWDFLVLDRFDNLSAVKKFKGPVLVVHGKADEIIPFSHGVSLAEAAGRGRLAALDCGHNDCPPEPDRFAALLADFLALCNPPGPLKKAGNPIHP